MYYLIKNQGIKKLKDKVSELELYGDCSGNSYGATFLVFTDYSIVEETDCVELSPSLLEQLRLLKAYLTLRIKHWFSKLDPSYQEPF
jgi:hypothetical protein